MLLCVIRPIFVLITLSWTAELGLIRDSTERQPDPTTFHYVRRDLIAEITLGTCHPSILARPPILMFRLSLRPLDCAVYL